MGNTVKYQIFINGVWHSTVEYDNLLVFLTEIREETSFRSNMIVETLQRTGRYTKGNMLIQRRSGFRK